MVQVTPTLGSAEALRRLAQSRDVEAWAVILEQNGQEIQRVSRRILQDANLAEDACQETLLQVREGAPSFSPRTADADADARRWIVKVACRTALEMLRSRGRSLARERERERTTPPPHEGPEGERSLMDLERAEAVRRELAEMRPVDRLPVVLHYYGGLDYGDLSKALGCPVGTAKARVHRGVEKLRNRLALLGLIFAFGELTACLGSTRGEAAEAGSYALSRKDGWAELLNSPRRPALEPELEKGGLSTMSKIGIGAAALLALGIVAFTAFRSGAADREAGASVNRDVKTGGMNAAAPAAPPARPAAEADNTPPKGGAENAAPATDAEKRAAADGNNAFGLDLFAKLREGEKGNLFFSPYSISSALAMTLAGARGETAKQMEKALRVALAQDRYHAGMGALVADLNAAEKDGKKREYQLSVANRLFGQKGLQFLPDFLAVTRNRYGAGLEEMDFRTATEPSRLAINKWVEEQTREKIKDLIPKGLLSPITGLVLVNAIYFKGDWTHAFKKELTKNEPFHFADGTKAESPLMLLTESFKYQEEEGRMQMVQLPYKGGELSMLVFLPSKPDGLPELEGGLTAARISETLAAAKMQKVTVRLPRFKMTWSKMLKPSLSSLGMSDAFIPEKADFAGINRVTRPEEALSIYEVVHKAFVDVNEEGTEAAAATAVIGFKGSAPRPPKVFRADRPFLFVIRDEARGSILFMGRVMDPR